MSRTGHTQKSLDELAMVLDLMQDELILRDLMPYASEQEKTALYRLIKLVKEKRRTHEIEK